MDYRTTPETALVDAIEIEGGVAPASTAWGVSPAAIYHALNGDRKAGPKLLGALLGRRRIAGMIVLISGATKTFARFKGNPNFGHLKTPRNGNSVTTIAASGHPWACDNDCFTGFREAKFIRMLDQVATANTTNLLWVSAPDIVGDCRATLALFGEWQPRIAAMGLPVALVGQDGAEDAEVPWDRMSALFIGGSTQWKLSAAAESLASEARARGKLIHMGRVNSARRLRHAWEIGCHSVDGTCFSRWPDRYFPEALATLRSLRRQPAMF